MSTILIFAVALAGVIWAAQKLLRLTQRPKLEMPYLEFDDGNNSMERYVRDTTSIMERGYNEYLKKGEPFAMFNHVDFTNPIVVLPLKYLEEVRSAPQSKLSFPVSLEKSIIVNDIGGPRMTDSVIHVVRLDLNRALNELIEPMHQACVEGYKTVMPPCPDWTSVMAYQSLLMLFSRITARALVGPELYENDEWHMVLLQYINAAVAASQGVREKYHPWMRWTAKYFDKDVKAVYAARRKAGELLRPVLAARLASTSLKSQGEEPRYNDAVQWLVDEYRTMGRKVKVDDLAQDEVIIAIASIHSSAATALSILFDLIDRPESLAEIQNEIFEVHAKYGGWSRRSLGALRVMDSFMKESQRLHTLQHVTMQRMAIEPYTFKDGLHLPVGTQVFLPNKLVGLDPDIHPDAAKFDPKRWVRMRNDIDSNRFHFASVQDDMIPFGSGLHACPGRFLAQEVMKLMFIHLLTHYDIKYPEGVESRPSDIPQYHNIMPNMMTSLLFKER